MSLISRFDAAQEAFAANSVELKKITKKHKKELKAAKAETRAALIEVEALKAELAILKAGGPAKKEPTAKKSAAKRGPGRPKKAATTTKATPALTQKQVTPAAAAAATPADKPADKPAVKPVAKRGPGRPKKAATKAAAKPAVKRGPGRPKKKKAATAAAATTTTPTTAPTAAPKPATPKATGAKKKGPGRPRKKPAAPASPLQAIKGVGPAMAAQFEAAGVKTPAAMAKLSNTKMAAILEKCGPRYRNADATKMQAYRDAATAAK